MDTATLLYFNSYFQPNFSAQKSCHHNTVRNTFQCNTQIFFLKVLSNYCSFKIVHFLLFLQELLQIHTNKRHCFSQDIHERVLNLRETTAIQNTLQETQVQYLQANSFIAMHGILTLYIIILLHHCRLHVLSFQQKITHCATIFSPPFYNIST